LPCPYDSKDIVEGFIKYCDLQETFQVSSSSRNHENKEKKMEVKQVHQLLSMLIKLYKDHEEQKGQAKEKFKEKVIDLLEHLGMGITFYPLLPCILFG
jgi:hypothetical protein